MIGRCYLVRHGQSEWNMAGLTQGQASSPALTPLGRSQASDAATLVVADLAGHRDDVRVVTSDLTRARQTAEVLAARLGVTPLDDPRLREQHLGHLEGRPYAETWAYGERHDWSDPELPVAGGEAPAQVQRRMAAVLDEVARQPPTSVTVLVSHGDAIRAALAHLAGVAVHRAAWVEVPNGAVARVDGGGVCWLGLLAGSAG